MVLALTCTFVVLLPTNASADHSHTELASTGPNIGNGPPWEPLTADLSADGNHLFFYTRESLVPEDTDTVNDLYERFNGTTTLISTGPTDNGSADGYATYTRDGSRVNYGTHVIFTSHSRLVAEDTDDREDVYDRSGGTTRLVSIGPSGGNDSYYDATFEGASEDGSRLFFTTDEKLVPEDTDRTDTDVYERSGGNTTLVSIGSQAQEQYLHFPTFGGNSKDGTRVFFQTSEPLVSEDVDVYDDIFERSGGTTTLISEVPGNEVLGNDAFFQAATDDGNRVFFMRGPLYERSGGQTTQISPTRINSYFDFAGLSSDGSHVFWETRDPLVAEDRDPPGGCPYWDDENQVWIPEDCQDIYENFNGQIRLVSTGPDDPHNGVDATAKGVSADGRRVLFVTTDPMVDQDTNAGQDVYERLDGTSTTAISVGSDGRPGGGSFVDSSADGRRAFFASTSRLVPFDTDNLSDVYERYAGTTTLISTGPTDDGTGSSYGGRASDDGTHFLVRSLGRLTSDDNDGPCSGYTGSCPDIYDVSVRPYTKPIGASPLRVSLVPAFRPCETDQSDSVHGSPLVFGSCSGPRTRSSIVTLGPTSLGFAGLLVCPGGTAVNLCNPPGGNLPKPDVRLSASISDVRCGPAVPVGDCSAGDYDPNPAPSSYADLGDGSAAPVPACFPEADSETACVAAADVTEIAKLPGAGLGGQGTMFEGEGVRITDRDNGTGSLTQRFGATVADIGFPIPIDCVPTTSPSAGSACGVNTTANAMVPGVVSAGNGGVWQIGQIEFQDSGRDGLRATSDDEVFATQGVFIR